jgi:hypothetical protein
MVEPITIATLSIIGINVAINVSTLAARGWYSFTKSWYRKFNDYIINEERLSRSVSKFNFLTVFLHGVIDSAESKGVIIPKTTVDINGNSYNTMIGGRFMKMEFKPTRARRRALGLSAGKKIIFWIYSYKDAYGSISGYDIWCPKKYYSDMNQLCVCFARMIGCDVITAIRSSPIIDKTLKLQTYEFLFNDNCEKMKRISDSTEIQLQKLAIDMDDKDKNTIMHMRGKLLHDNYPNTDLAISIALAFNDKIYDPISSVSDFGTQYGQLKTIYGSGCNPVIANAIEVAFLSKNFNRFIESEVDKYGLVLSRPTMQTSTGLREIINLNKYRIEEFFHSMLKKYNSYPRYWVLFLESYYMFVLLALTNNRNISLDTISIDTDMTSGMNVRALDIVTPLTSAAPATTSRADQTSQRTSLLIDSSNVANNRSISRSRRRGT